MAVKANWENGEQFNASDANAVAEAVNAAYVKPTGGVPITDLTASVQVSLGKADTAVQSVSSTSITDSTTTGRAVITAADASAARTTLGVSYGTTAGTVAEGNDPRLSPSSTSITDSTATGRSLITAADPAAARTTLGVAYGSTGGTVAQGNDSRIVGAEQAANKGVANGYASLDGGGKVPVSQLPSSIMEYQGTYNASTNSPSLSNGTGNTGDVYRVTVAGSRNFGAGSISFEVGDYVIYNGSVWEKSDTTDAVSTVAGLTGDVTASSLRGAIATGTPSSSTWLRGDGQWQTLPASGITRSVQTITTPTTLGAAANTDYVYFCSSSTSTSTSTVAEPNQILLHFDGSNGSTTITDTYGNSTWAVNGSISLSTANKKFGTASLGAGTTNAYVYPTSGNSIFNFGTGDFTIEFWAYITSNTTFLYDNGAGQVICIENTSVLYYQAPGNQNAISGTYTQFNAWAHIAVCRSSGVTKMFVNGTQFGSSYTDASNYSVAANRPILGNWAGGLGNVYYLRGNIDEFRVTKSARYTTNFTAPTAAFPDSPEGVAVTTTVTSFGTPTLPTAVSNTNQYTLKNLTSSPLVIGTTSSQKIDGSNATSMTGKDSAVSLVSDNANWRIVNSFGAVNDIGWTLDSYWLAKDNIGTATIAASGLNRVLTSSASGNSDSTIRWEYQTLSQTTRYTAICALTPSSVGRYGMFIRESSTGKIHSLLMANSNSALWVGKWTNATTFSADSYIAALADARWFRIRDDGTTKYFDYSKDAVTTLPGLVTWTNFYSVARNDWLVADQVGWAGAPSNSNTLTLNNWQVTYS